MTVNDAQLKTLRSLLAAIQGLAATAEGIVAEAAGMVEGGGPTEQERPRLSWLGDDEPTQEPSNG